MNGALGRSSAACASGSAAASRASTRAEHVLGQVHQRLVRRVRLVELEHRELGVVPRRDALVAVAAADLVDALEPAHDQALQVQLRRDAHEEVHVERVVVGLERLRGGAADERVHRRRLDLEEARARRGTAQPRTMTERATKTSCDLGVGDEVDVALAVALLDVVRPCHFSGSGRSALVSSRGRASARSTARRSWSPWGCPRPRRCRRRRSPRSARRRRTSASLATEELDLSLSIAQAEEGRLPDAHAAPPRVRRCVPGASL